MHRVKTGMEVEIEPPRLLSAMHPQFVNSGVVDHGRSPKTSSSAHSLGHRKSCRSVPPGILCRTRAFEYTRAAGGQPHDTAARDLRSALERFPALEQG